MRKLVSDIKFVVAIIRLNKQLKNKKNDSCKRRSA